MNWKDKFIALAIKNLIWVKTREWKNFDGTIYIYYYLNNDPNLGSLTVEKQRNKGYRIRNVFVDASIQRQGYATKIYKQLNQESIEQTGKPLQSSEIGYDKKNSVTTLGKEGQLLWQSFVEKGFAEKVGDHYEFLGDNMDKLPSIKSIKPLLKTIIQAAQNEYDSWGQDEDGIDLELGEGGLCQDIADAISNILNSNGIDACGVGQSVGEQHVFVIAKFKEGVFDIDIAPSHYEFGSGYRWKKKPNVIFSIGMITVQKIDSNPNKFEQYVD
jgi:hypothetical protein